MPDEMEVWSGNILRNHNEEPGGGALEGEKSRLQVFLANTRQMSISTAHSLILQSLSETA